MKFNDLDSYFVYLFGLNIIPLRVCVGALALGLYEYFITLDDEVKYIWKQKQSLGKMLFFWIRYYTLALLVFDVFQIHIFAIPGFATVERCVFIDPLTRILGGISLWSVEIYMQLRIYALYNRSRKVAIFNGITFVISMGFFLWLMVYNAQHRGAMIAKAAKLPLPGCPVINGGLNWALWIPPTLFEGILFGFALYKCLTSTAAQMKLGGRLSFTAILLGDNIIYFLSITILLVLNNLMAASAATRVPWFSMAPFHAMLGIITTRIMISFYKHADRNSGNTAKGDEQLSRPIAFAKQAERHPTTLSSDSEDDLTPDNSEFLSSAYDDYESDELDAAGPATRTFLRHGSADEENGIAFLRPSTSGAAGPSRPRSLPTNLAPLSWQRLSLSPLTNYAGSKPGSSNRISIV